MEELLDDSQRDPDELCEAEEDTLCETEKGNEGLELCEGETLADAKTDADAMGDPESETLDEPLWEADAVQQLEKVPPEGDASELSEGGGDEEKLP